jgi:D-glycero-D-manno-heptose 1,7-bisphosphate phosphatase
MTRRPAVFLDRDGVLNETSSRAGVSVPPPDAEHFQLLPGVSDACASLAAAGLVLVVVTNQPDVSRGLLDPGVLDRMHRRLNDLLTLDAIYVCPHDTADGCPCRKPRPGMILQAAADFGLDLNRSVCVGDRWRDIDAAAHAGVRAVHIAGNDPEPLRAPADASFLSLYDAVDAVIGFTQSSARDGSAT